MALQRLWLFIDYSPKQFFPEISRSMNDLKKTFFNTLLIDALAILGAQKKKIRKIPSVKVYSNLKPSILIFFLDFVMMVGIKLKLKLK